MKSLNWAVLGCGIIANEFAVALSNHGENLYAVCNRTYEKAVEFAKKHNVQKVYKNFDDVLLDENVDIVYITTPHNTHIKFLKKAISSGKNVLCEKSITLNSDELIEATNLAKTNNVIVAEAMTLYHMPILKKLDDIVKSEKLGNVNIITLNFGSFKEYDMENRFFNRNLAGGAMLDIGVYAISCARWFLKSSPNNVLSQVKMAPTNVDESATVIMMNSENQMATIALSLHSKQPKRAMISCDKGFIEIMEYPRAMTAQITYVETGEKETIECGNIVDALYYEKEDMENAVLGIENKMHLDYTVDVMDIMTKVRKSWNMTYPEEE